MIVFKCDRCGETYEENYDINAIKLLHNSLNGNSTVEDEIELCPECIKKLNVFFRNVNERIKEKSVIATNNLEKYDLKQFSRNPVSFS